MYYALLVCAVQRAGRNTLWLPRMVVDRLVGTDVSRPRVAAFPRPSRMGHARMGYIGLYTIL